MIVQDRMHLLISPAVLIHEHSKTNHFVVEVVHEKIGGFVLLVNLSDLL